MYMNFWRGIKGLLLNYLTVEIYSAKPFIIALLHTPEFVYKWYTGIEKQ